MLTDNRPLLGGGSGGASDTVLRGKNVRTTRFASISAGAGTLSLPPSASIVMDDFGGGTDAITAKIAAGKPIQESAKTSSDAPISVSLDILGNYVLSGVPSAYPIAVIYRVEQTAENFDSDATDIIGIPSFVDVTDSNLQLSDVTTNNASTTKHGFLKKLSGDNTQYMCGDGSWKTPAFSELTGTNQTIINAIIFG